MDLQASQLKGVKRVYVLLDSDAVDKAVVMGRRLRELQKPIVHVITLPTGDPDDYTKTELREMIGRAIPFSFVEETMLTASVRWKKPKEIKGIAKKQ